MTTCISTLLTILIYCAVGSICCQVIIEVFIHSDLHRDKVKTRQFMAMIYTAVVLFCIVIAAAGWHADKKEASTAAEAKAERKEVCNNLTDDVNAYVSADAFFARRDKCALEFGKVKLVKSGAVDVWPE